jgi:hypothetical protein
MKKTIFGATSTKQKTPNLSRKLIGYVGVDSGQIMVCDPCYIDSSWEKKDWASSGDFKKKCKENKDKFNYLGACHVTLSKELAGQCGLGVATSSGYGDGTYPVYVTYRDRRVKKIEVVFF